MNKKRINYLITIIFVIIFTIAGFVVHDFCESIKEISFEEIND